MLRRDIVEPSTGLVSGAFVNDMEDWFSVDVEDIDDNGVVKVNVVLQGKTESSGGSAVLLAVFAVLRKVVEGVSINVVAGSL